MKKTLKTIKNFFQKIGKFFDKYLVTPISKSVLFITKKISNSGKAVETWLSKTNTLLFVSLLISITMFIVIDQEILKYSQSTAEVLESLPVTADYNKKAYVVEGIPETVDITLIGNKTDLFIAKQMPSPEITVDLTNLGVGKHEVKIKYNQSVGNLKYMINPSTVTVEIFERKTQTASVTADLLNQSSLDSKLVVESVELDANTDDVSISGPEYKLKQVATVKALIDLSELGITKAGEYKVENAPLKAYNSRGEVVDVEIVPGKVNATVTVKSPAEDIPIKIVLEGEVVFGKAIKSITPSVDKVTVYGSSEAIEALKSTGIEVKVDVTNLKDNKIYKMDLPKPVGIKSMSVNSITIQVVLDTISDRDIENVKINFDNVESGYIANATRVEDEKLAVNVQGVDSVIKSITSDDIYAYVDLKGKGPGTYKVDIYLKCSDTKITCTRLKKTIEVAITKKK